MCLKHIDTTTPLIIVIPETKPYIYGLLGSGKNASPEARKAYNRKYRKKYRETHPRKHAYVWPKNLDYYNSKLWLVGTSYSALEATYHCDRCCQQIKVTRTRCPPPSGTRFIDEKYQHFWVAGYHYRASVGHKCDSCISVQLRHCDRCGIIGSKSRINNNRIPKSYYDDKLCLTCWHIVRPLYQLYEDQMELYCAVKNLRKVMRSTGSTPYKWTVKHLYLDFSYMEGWYKERGKYSVKY